MFYIKNYAFFRYVAGEYTSRQYVAAIGHTMVHHKVKNKDAVDGAVDGG